MGLFDIFSNDAAKDAARHRTQGLQKGQADAYGYIDQGLTGAQGQYGAAARPFDALYQRGIKGYDAYSDALGLNGPQGVAQAQARFQTGPGYQFALNQGLDALDRRAASRGMLASGNTNLDTINYAQGTANQEWNNYLNRLGGFSTGAQNAATGQAAVRTGLGNLLSNTGNLKGGIAYQTATGIGDANAQADLDRLRSSGQFWNMIGGGANLFTSAFGRGGPWGSGGAFS